MYFSIFCRGSSRQYSERRAFRVLYEALPRVSQDSHARAARGAGESAVVPARLLPEGLHRAQAAQVSHVWRDFACWSQ